MKLENHVLDQLDSSGYEQAHIHNNELVTVDRF